MKGFERGFERVVWWQVRIREELMLSAQSSVGTQARTGKKLRAREDTRTGKKLRAREATRTGKKLRARE